MGRQFSRHKKLSRKRNTKKNKKKQRGGTLAQSVTDDEFMRYKREFGEYNRKVIDLGVAVATQNGVIKKLREKALESQGLQTVLTEEIRNRMDVMENWGTSTDEKLDLQERAQKQIELDWKMFETKVNTILGDMERKVNLALTNTSGESSSLGGELSLGDQLHLGEQLHPAPQPNTPLQDNRAIDELIHTQETFDTRLTVLEKIKVIVKSGKTGDILIRAG